MKARFYVYRNLHTGTFSLKFKGKVIKHPKEILLKDVNFSVSEKGRQRVINEKRKNVHATVNGFPTRNRNVRIISEVYYNPYTTKNFQVNGKDIKNTNYVLCKDNKIYIVEPI